MILLLAASFVNKNCIVSRLFIANSKFLYTSDKINMIVHEDNYEDDEREMDGREIENRSTTDGGVWACCHFKEFVLRRTSTQTRGAREINFGDYMTRYDACDRCQREYENINARCDNPFQQSRHENYRHNVFRLRGKYKDRQKYPIFENCRYVCAICMIRARKERHARKIKSRTRKALKKKVVLLISFFYFFFFTLKVEFVYLDFHIMTFHKIVTHNDSYIFKN